mgnify:FL=1
MIQFFQCFAVENRKHYFRFFTPQNRRYDLLKIYYKCVILISEPSSNLENHMTVCMEYPAKSPYEDEPENTAGKGQEHHTERTA